MATELLIHGMEVLLVLGAVGVVAEWIYSIRQDRKDARPAELPEEQS